MSCIISSRKQSQLARQIAAACDLPIIEAHTVHFADSEMRIDIDDQVQKHNQAIIVHATSRPVHENLMWLLLTCHELKKHCIDHIWAVIPYFGYARQTKNNDGSDGAARMIAQLLEAAGISTVITVELHEPALTDFFSIPIYNVTLERFIAHHLKTWYANDCTLIAPDEGARDRVATIASYLDAPTMVFKKERYAVNQTRIVASEGSCQTKYAVIIDDIIDTGSTIIDVAQVVHDAHPTCSISAFGVHPVLSAHAADCLQQSVFERVYVTNTIPLSSQQQFEKCEILDVSPEITKVLHELL